MLRQRQTEPLQHRRQNVDMLGESVYAHASRTSIGRTNNHRNVIRLIEEARLAVLPVIAHLLAVIRGKHDQRFLVRADTLQMAKQATEVVVHFRHESEVSGL